jgi:hypothetical protein
MTGLVNGYNPGLVPHWNVTDTPGGGRPTDVTVPFSCALVALPKTEVALPIVPHADAGAGRVKMEPSMTRRAIRPTNLIIVTSQNKMTLRLTAVTHYTTGKCKKSILTAMGFDFSLRKSGQAG